MDKQDYYAHLEEGYDPVTGKQASVSPEEAEKDLPRPDWRDAELIDHRKERLRIEALRAAAQISTQIWAAIANRETGPEVMAKFGSEEQIATSTILYAKQFAKWLEDG